MAQSEEAEKIWFKDITGVKPQQLKLVDSSRIARMIVALRGVFLASDLALSDDTPLLIC